MDIGKTITTLRKSKEITQESLAKQCGITQAYLSQIEKNKKEPNLSTIRCISSALNTPLAVLFFLSIEANDVPESRKEIFELMKPSMTGFFETVFDDVAKGNN